MKGSASASRGRLRGLQVLADDGDWPHGVLPVARAACAGGAAVVQLRAKRAGDRQILAWAAEIRELTRAHGVLFVVNDRFDLALAAGADGVHLGQEDLAPRDIPVARRGELLVGRSTHSLEQARAAADEPIDYLAFGPLFDTRSKATGYTARGLGALARVVEIAEPLPVVAIGGIDLERAARVSEAGAAGAAVLSAVAGARDPEAATRELARALRGSPP